MNLDTISINQTLPAITCDYESLRQWAKSITEKYQDLVVREEDIKAIKSDMAELNKAKQKLERARIDTVKAISAPIREFEAQIKDISGLFDAAYKALADQVKTFEEAEKQKKKDDVVDVIIAMECGFAHVDTDIIKFDPRWLNKSTSNAEIRNAVKAQIAAHKQTIVNPLLAVNQNHDTQPAKQDNAPQEANSAPLDLGEISRERMDAEIAQHDKAHPRTIWQMTFSYAPEQEEEVRRIFQDCQFMRIVRKLDSIGIKAAILKQKVNGQTPQVIYVPTEAGLPILEAGRAVNERH